tara:strand:- start:300 stop:500 length:201 start_codon:yes stop_codon:yes gene_type:complete
VVAVVLEIMEVVAVLVDIEQGQLLFLVLSVLRLLSEVEDGGEITLQEVEETESQEYPHLLHSLQGR